MAQDRRTKPQLLAELDRLTLQVGELRTRLDGLSGMDKSVRDGERMLHNLFEGSRDAIYVTSRDGRFVDINRAGLELFGYSREDIIGREASQLYHCPHDRARFQSEIEQKGFVREYEVKLKHKNGKLLDCLLTSTVWLSDDHEPMGYQGIIRDITAHKQQEENLRQSFVKMQRTMEGIIHAISLTLEIRDPYTAGHQRRVSDLAQAIAQEMQLPEKRVEGIRLAGIIHDIGKIYIPAEILSKPGRISEIEFNIIKLHPEVGYDILKNIEFPWPIAPSVLQHHERWNGSGYPAGLVGEAILLEARILCVADVIEVMASHRPYRPALGLDKALEEILRNRGELYDPAVVDVAIRLFEEKHYTFNFAPW